MIEPRLISWIWDIVLNKRWPCHKETKKLATETSWQAHYILWANLMDLKDPCGNEPG
jgi:hypothetical protein